MDNRNEGFRFAVRSEEGLTSEVWRVWTHDNDVYIGSVRTAAFLKASLHASGCWRFAITKPYAEKNQMGQRCLLEWRRPAELAPGFTHAFTIVMPRSELRHHPHKAQPRRSVTWIPAPAEGNHTQVDLLLLSEGKVVDRAWSRDYPQVPDGRVLVMAQVPGWPGRKGGTELIGKLALPIGETLWAVWRHVTDKDGDLTQLEIMREQLRSRLQQAHPGHPATLDIRYVVFDVEADGSGKYVDIALE